MLSNFLTRIHFLLKFIIFTDRCFRTFHTIMIKQGEQEKLFHEPHRIPVHVLFEKYYFTLVALGNLYVWIWYGVFSDITHYKFFRIEIANKIYK